jgi:hypothetical protein
MLFSNLILIIGNIIWVSMMYKYVLTHQPNMVNLYALGCWVAGSPACSSPTPFRRGRLLIIIWKHILGAIGGQLIETPTSQRPPHGASGSPKIRHLNLPRKRHLALPRNWSLSPPGRRALSLSRCRHLSHPRSQHLPLSRLWQRKPIIMCLTIKSTSNPHGVGPVKGYG